MKRGRKLPEINILGRPWLVNVDDYEIIDKEHPANSIAGYEMRYSDNGYRFAFSKRYQNLSNPLDGETDEVVTVNLFHFTEMDPEGVAKKYGLKVNEVKGKTDYEVMEDKRALIDRMRGRQTTVDIAGHTFYVDFPMEMLRPEDNFFSNGIPFSELDHYYNEELDRLEVSYNKQTQELEEVDYENIVEQPDNLLIVAFPTPDKLDPVGYARAHGFDVGFVLEDGPQKAHFKAEILRGKDSWLTGLIEENRQRLGHDKPVRKKKGRRI